MSEGQPKAQPVTQAGSPGEAASVGLEVGVLRSSEEIPVMGVERRRGTCPGGSSGTWPKAPQGDKPRGRKVPKAVFSAGGNASVEPGSESRIRETRPSGLMRGRNRKMKTNNHGRFNLTHPVPAYSTMGFGSRCAPLRYPGWRARPPPLFGRLVIDPQAFEG
jgi:hypothetical protein